MRTCVLALATSAVLLSACNAIQPYQEVSEGPTAELTLAADLSTEGLSTYHVVRYHMRKCATEWLGEIVLIPEKGTKQVRIPAGRHFYSDVLVEKHDQLSRSTQGTTYIAFVPQQNEKYRLSYRSEYGKYGIDLFRFDASTSQWIAAELSEADTSLAPQCRGA